MPSLGVMGFQQKGSESLLLRANHRPFAQGHFSVPSGKRGWCSFLSEAEV